MERAVCVAEGAGTAVDYAVLLASGGSVRQSTRSLKRAGYVRRRPDRSDRRRLLVEATPLTAARDIEVFADLVRATTESLAAYSATDLAVIRFGDNSLFPHFGLPRTLRE
jgi:hypothetical protein